MEYFLLFPSIQKNFESISKMNTKWKSIEKHISPRLFISPFTPFWSLKFMIVFQLFAFRRMRAFLGNWINDTHTHTQKKRLCTLIRAFMRCCQYNVVFFLLWWYMTEKMTIGLCWFGYCLQNKIVYRIDRGDKNISLQVDKQPTVIS